MSLPYIADYRTDEDGELKHRLYQHPAAKKERGGTGSSSQRRWNCSTYTYLFALLSSKSVADYARPGSRDYRVLAWAKRRM